MSQPMRSLSGQWMRGFTLVELLVCMGIIALLIGILVPTLSGARARAQSTECQSNLRQLYFAQTYYADQHKGRWASAAAPGMGLDGWEDGLRRYLAPRSLDTRKILTCPSARDEDRLERSTYGANSCLIMPNWQARRDRKFNTSEIILMGEKAPNGDDWLVTEDKYYLTPLGEAQAWFVAINHKSKSSYRHEKGMKANMLMADGHVVAMSREQLVRDSGHWYWNPGQEFEEYEYGGPCCE